MVEKHRARLLEIEKKRLSSLQDLADAIGQQSITIEANANDEGHLYGSVGAAEIVSALKQAGTSHYRRPGSSGRAAQRTRALHREDSVCTSRSRPN